ncbi:HDOD domain-containing protein [bacterium]|nr:HDOD domain-containing protein [bacterium]
MGSEMSRSRPGNRTTSSGISRVASSAASVRTCCRTYHSSRRTSVNRTIAPPTNAPTKKSMPLPGRIGRRRASAMGQATVAHCPRSAPRAQPPAHSSSTARGLPILTTKETSMATSCDHPVRETVASVGRALASEIDGLPRLSVVLERFLARAHDSTASVGAITADLAADPTIERWLLRQANSGYHAVARPLADVGEACVVLGLETVARMAYAACSRNLLGHASGPYAGTERGAWLHGLAVSSAAGRLAALLEDRSPLTPTTARVAGLLHDVGKQLVIARWPAHDRGPVRDVAHERATVGFDHASASAAVAASWDLPAHLVVAIATHHDPQPPPAARLLAAADRLMNHWRVGTTTYPRLDAEPPRGELATIVLPLGAGPETIDRWCEEMPPLVAGFDEMLRWSTRPAPPEIAAPAPASSDTTPAGRARGRRSRRERRDASGRRPRRGRER